MKNFYLIIRNSALAKDFRKAWMYVFHGFLPYKVQLCRVVSIQQLPKRNPMMFFLALGLSMVLLSPIVYAQQQMATMKSNLPVASAKNNSNKGREAAKGEVNFTELANYLLAHPEPVMRREPENEDDDAVPPRLAVPDPSMVHRRAESREAYSSYHSSYLPVSASPADTFESTIDNAEYIPPDTHGGVDSNYCVTAINAELHIQTRAGANVSTVSLNSFFSSVYSNSGTFDPRVHYDPTTHRWIVMCVADAEATTSCILIAVSETSNPTGSWYTYKITADGTGVNWLDFPDLGFNKKWIAVTGNLFSNSAGDFNGAKVFVFNKATMLAGTGAGYTSFIETEDFTICPALTYDTTETSLFAIESYNGTGGYMNMWKVAGAVGSETLTQVGYPTTSTLWFGSSNSGASVDGFAPQAGSSNHIQTNDDRVTQCTQINGKLWFAHTVFLPYSATDTAHRSSVQWWETDTLANPVQVGYIDDPSNTNFYAFPTIAVNTNNDALIGFSAMSASTYASSAYATHLHTDPVDSTRPLLIFRHGMSSYYKTYGGTRNRWGDYSGTMVDPINGTNFWTIQEAASSTTNNWDTWWAFIPVGCTTGAITGTMTLCTGATTPLADTSAGGTWSSTNTSVATISSSGVVTGAVAGTTTISYTVTNGCGTQAATTVVTVNPIPTINVFPASATYCSPGGTPATTTASGSGGTYLWEPGGVATSTLSVTPSTTTLYTVVGTSPAGCSAIATFTVAVSATPTVNVSPSSIVRCSTDAGNTITASGIATSYTWSPATGLSASTGASVITTATSTVTYTITGHTSTCSASKTLVVSVNPSPSISGLSSTEQSVCYSGSLIQTSPYTYTTTTANEYTLTWSPTGGPSNISSYTAISSPINVSIPAGGAPGNYTGTLSLLNSSTGCISTATTTLTINALPAPTFTAQPGASACTNTNVTYTTQSGFVLYSWGIPGVCGTDYNIVSPSGGCSAGLSSTNSITLQWLTTGSKTVTINYYNASGCTAAAATSATATSVISSPSAGTITGSTTLCTGTTTQLTDAISGGTWSSTNTAVGTIGSTGIAGGTGTGTTTISYTVSNSCSAVAATYIVTVNGIPSVTSISPIMGYPASSVIVSGTNFNSTGSDDIVYFGATRATVSAATTTSLNVTVPTGATYMPVSVLNTGCGLTGYADYPFLQTYNNSAYLAGVNFDTQTLFATMTGPQAIAIGDLDGDGKSDIVVSSSTSDSVMVYHNTSSAGTVSYSLSLGFPAGNPAGQVVIEDMDGDGKPDLLVAAGVDHSVLVYLNTSSSGSISFAAPVSVSTGITLFDPSGIATSDLDGDGKPDMVVANVLMDRVGIFRNTSSPGSVSFATIDTITIGGAAASVAIGDLDGDGKPDVALAGNTYAAYLLRNTSTPGSISFAHYYGVSLLTLSSGIAIGDIDGDGKPELIVSEQGEAPTIPPSAVVYRNSSFAGTLSFISSASFATGNGPGVIAMGDIDGDGKTDLAISNSVDNTISVLRNTASYGSITSSSFATQVTFPTGNTPSYITEGDIDGDGKPDLAFTNSNDNTFGILRNDPLALISGATSVCAGSNITLSDATVDGTWSSSNSIIASVGSTGIVTGVAVGTATIYYTVAGGSTSITVTVNPGGGGAGTISGASTVCGNAFLQLSDATTGGTWSSSNISVATIASTGVVYGISQGTTTISYTVTYGCGSVSATTNITVLPIPTMYTATGGGSYCSGGGGVDVGLNGSQVGVSYQLYNGGTPIDTALAGTGSALDFGLQTLAGSYGIVSTYTVTGCTNGNYGGAVISILPSPSAGTITGVTSVCSSSTTNLADTATGGVWSSSNSSIATVSSSGTVTGVTGGTVTISYTVANTCGTVNATTVVTVNACAGTITGASTVCLGSTITLTDAATGGTWSSSNTGIAMAGSTGIVTGEAAGTATISYTVGGSSATAVVTVNAVPTAAPANNGPICNGGTVTLSANPSGATIFSWSGPNLSSATVANPTATPSVSCTYSLTVGSGGGSGCSSTVYTTEVTVESSVNAGSITGTPTVCAGSTTNLTDAAIFGVWSSGAAGIATVGSSGIVTGVATGTAIISYTVTNACGSASATDVVTVNAATSAGTIGGPSGVTVGTNITLTDAVSGGAWSASNGNATVSSGLVTGVTAGTVTISYTVTGICGTAYVTKVITVNTASLPGITGIASICAGTTTSLTDATAGGTWMSSNGTIATVGGTTGIVTGVAAGTANITYTQGGTYTTITVTVNTTPSVVMGASSECVGATITLSDATAGGSWSASNSNVSVSGSMVTGVVAGTSTITYMLSTGCYITYPNTIHPDPSPITGTTMVCVGSTTTLGDTTSGALSYSSSNTTVATVLNSGVVTGVAGGTVTITYKITSGCYTTTTVTVNSLPSIISGNMPVCAGSAITVTDSAGAGIWSSSNAAIATIGSASGVLTGVAGGTTTITYTNGSTGCMRTAVVTVNAILPITGGTNVCTGTSTTLSDGSAGGTWSSGNTGIATVGSASGIVTGVSTGSVLITYTLASGCNRTINVNVGTMTPIMGAMAQCASSTTTLTDATSGGTWSISTPLIATIGSATGLVTTSGTYTGTATISYTLGGCSVTSVLSVNAKPSVIAGASSECVGVTITLSDATAGGTWSASNVNVTVSGSTVTGAVAGTSTITYTAATGCYVTYPNTIHANPSAINGTLVVCAGMTTTLNDTTTGALSWASSNTASATVLNSGVVTGVAAGTATITYKITSGCYTTAVVTVNPSPVVTAISGPASIAEGAPMTLSDVTAGGIWSSSHSTIIALSGSTGSPVTATAVATSSASIISYAVTNGFGCTITVTKTITATMPPPHGGSTTGVDPVNMQEKGTVLLYPNPTNGAINIRSDAAGVFYLYSADGKLLAEYKVMEGITNITLSNELTTGIYIGRYKGDDGSTAEFKIIKN